MEIHDRTGGSQSERGERPAQIERIGFWQMDVKSFEGGALPVDGAREP